jgi:hypothetical protein
MKLVEHNPFVLEESLKIKGIDSKIEVEELFALFSALQRDTTLKTVGCHVAIHQYSCETLLSLTDNEVKEPVPVPVIVKNYGGGLELLVPDLSCADDRVVRAHFEAQRGGTPVSDRRRIFHLKRTRRIECC